MKRCDCGSEASGAFELGCVQCGAECCPACAIHLESTPYCERCARSLLETTTVHAGTPFELH